MLKLLFLAPLLVSVSAYAQDTGVPDVDPITTEDFFHYLMSSFGGLKGATALVIAAFVVQAIIRLLKTPLMNSFFLRIGGQWKITIVTGLTVVAGVIGLVSAGVPISAALVHSTTLSAFLVFMNQIYRQFTQREPVKLTPSDPSSPPSPMTVKKHENTRELGP
jgi:hypothetical protein